MSFSRKSFKQGFTLIEMLVVLVIFSILTGVVLIGQSKFNSSILLTNLAYDTALTLRQAQNYGINVKEFTNENLTKFVPYGVHFETGTNDKSFILFAELDYTSSNSTGDGMYHTDNWQARDPVVNASSCQTVNGCVNRYSIKRGNYISDICIDGTDITNGECGKTELDIVFQRPNPDAYIRVNNDALEIGSNATIILTGSDGTSSRRVRVWANGLIEILR
jgi:prepilin-type N-terminal cleavage/methylation domain-containing protein